MTVSIKPQSFVVELLKLAGSGSCDADIDTEAFEQAVQLLRNTGPTSDFEYLTFQLQDNNCSATDVFRTSVTNETHEAFAAYLCYCTD